jgi:hypothetical protein
MMDKSSDSQVTSQRQLMLLEADFASIKSRNFILVLISSASLIVSIASVYIATRHDSPKQAAIYPPTAIIRPVESPGATAQANAEKAEIRDLKERIPILEAELIRVSMEVRKLENDNSKPHNSDSLVIENQDGFLKLDPNGITIKRGKNVVFSVTIPNDDPKGAILSLNYGHISTIVAGGTFMITRDERPEVVLGLMPEGPSLSFVEPNSSEGTIRMTLGVCNTTVTATGTKSSSSPAMLTLFDKFGKVMWRPPVQ